MIVQYSGDSYTTPVTDIDHLEDIAYWHCAMRESVYEQRL